MDYKDYYKILGVARDANQDEIKRVYRRLARKFHPDVSKETNAEEKFKEVQEAYEVLKDPEKRAAYDQLGTSYRSGQEFRRPRTGARASNILQARSAVATTLASAISSRRCSAPGVPSDNSAAAAGHGGSRFPARITSRASRSISKTLFAVAAA